MKKRISVSLYSCLCLLPLALPQICPAQNSSKGFVLEAGKHSLQDIIQKAARFLGRNYLVSAEEMGGVQRMVTLQKTLNLDALGCEEVVSQLAYTHDFAMTPVDPKRGIYEFIYMRGGKRTEISSRALNMMPEEILRRPGLKMVALTTIALKHIDANRVTQQLRPFFAGAGAGGAPLQFGSAGSSKVILIQGFIDRVAVAIRMLEKADQPEAARTVNVTQAMLSRIAKLEKRLAALEKALASKKQ